MRYFTVKTIAKGRTYFVHVAAIDEWDATHDAMARNRSAICAQVVREFDRAEYERLTKH